jgi:triosephosphate isomerase
VGHSERRQFFGESDESAAKRAKNALSQGLSVIFCLGESLLEREAGQTTEVLHRQFEALALETAGDLGNSTRASGKLVLAYEPVWAIGTGKVAELKDISTAHALLKELATGSGGPMSVLYGGSVKPDNLQAIASLPNVDGALVGGASLDPKSWLQMQEILDKIGT